MYPHLYPLFRFVPLGTGVLSETKRVMTISSLPMLNSIRRRRQRNRS
jgi:hypothetical protein